MDDQLIKKLMSTMKCGVCGQRYEAGNINILGHRDELWFISVFCPACRSQGLVAAVVKEGKLPEIVTDLTETEHARFRQEAPVEADDVLDIHRFLDDFDGDFSRLFPKK